MTDSTSELFDAEGLPRGELPKHGAIGNVLTARVRLPNRGQMEFRASDLDSLLPQGHRARLVWSWVERQDLSKMYAGIKVVQGGVERRLRRRFCWRCGSMRR